MLEDLMDTTPAPERLTHAVMSSTTFASRGFSTQLVILNVPVDDVVTTGVLSEGQLYKMYGC